MRLELDASLDSLPRLQAEVRAFTAGRDIPSRTIGRLELVLEELFVNAVKYAFDDPTGQTVQFSLSQDGNEIVGEVTNGGRPFDPLTQSPTPSRTANLQERSAGGWGIAVVRRVTSAVEYQRRDDRNWLRFHLPVKPIAVETMG